MNEDGAAATARRFEPFILGTIVAIGAALRFTALDLHSASLDEASSMQDSASLREALGNYFHPPLYYALLRGWSALFGTEVATGRALSAACGTATILVVHRVALSFGARRFVALVAAALFACSPHAIWFARELRMYAPWTLFIACWAWAMAGVGEARLSPGRVAAIWLALLAAAGTHHYTAFFVAAGVPASMLLVHAAGYLHGARAIATRVSLVHAPAALGAAAFALRVSVGRGTDLGGGAAYLASRLADARDEPFMITLARIVFFRNWAYELAGPLATAAGAAVAALLVVGTALLLAARDGDRARAGALAVIAWAPLLVVAVAPIRSYTRLYAASTPFLAILLASAACAPLLLRERWRIAGATATIALVVGFMISLRPFIVDVFLLELEPWNEVCERIEREEGERDVVIIVASYMRKPFSLCFDGRSQVVTFKDERNGGLAPDRLAAATAGATGVWLIYSHILLADPDQSAGRALASRHALVEDWAPGALIRVLRFAPRAE